MDALGRLTGGVAHDFNNLLTVILGNATALRVGAEARGDANALRRAEMIERAAERGGRLASQLLAFSRRQMLRPEVISAYHIISATSELLAQAVGETVRIRIITESTLWNCHADPGQLESAIFNLVLNARDAMPAGGDVTISCRNHTEFSPRFGDFVRIDVKDTGRGIAPDMLQKVFEPFFTTKSVGQGSGLGLSQVHGFAGQSGGWVELSSTPGKGTIVSVFLPRDRRVERPKPLPAENPAESGKHQTVLIVEPDDDLRNTTGETMVRAGYHPLATANGSGALAHLVSDGRIDLLLTETDLPGGISGVQLARSARQIRPEMRVLLTSGAVKEPASGDEPFEYLVKPYRPADLVRVLGAALRRDTFSVETERLLADAKTEPGVAARLPRKELEPVAFAADTLVGVDIRVGAGGATVTAPSVAAQGGGAPGGGAPGGGPPVGVGPAFVGPAVVGPAVVGPGVTPARAANNTVRLGVMPFRVIGSGADAAFALGLAEEITTAFSRFRPISCVAPSSMATLVDEPRGQTQRWRQLDLDFLVEGSLRKKGNFIQVVLRLINMRGAGELSWGRRFDGGMPDMLNLQDRIALETAAQIAPELLNWQTREAASRPQVDPTAYDLMLRAIPLMDRLDESGYREAGRLLERSVALDPSSAAARSWLAQWHLVLLGQGWATDQALAIAQADQLSQQAVMLDPDDARGFTVAGHVRAFLHKDAQAALWLHERAIALNPSLAIAWCYSGLAHSYLGQHTEAIRRIRHAQQLSPHDPHGYFFDMALQLPFLLTGQYDAAIRSGQRARALNPALTSTYKGLIAALGLRGEKREAVLVRRTLLSLEPGFSVSAALLRSPLLRSEDRELYAEGLRRAGVPERSRF